MLKHNLLVYISCCSALAYASGYDQLTPGFIAMREVGVIVESHRFQNAAIEHVAMAAIVVIWFDVFQLQEPSHRGAVVHVDGETAGFFVDFHGEISGFFVERVAPIDPASA